MAPWRVFLSVKATEAIVSLRPRALARLFQRDRSLRHALRWCFRRSALVYLAEVADFFARRRRDAGPLAKVRGRPLAEFEYAQERRRPPTGAAPRDRKAA